MTEYGLYLESGPKRRKTMVHVLDLPGCTANGPTTEAALDATPDAIRAYLRFIRRHGVEVDPEAPFETRVVEHVTQGMWLGNGSPYLLFGPDLTPMTRDEVETYAERFHWVREALAVWAEAQTDAALDAAFPGGRSARAILLHIVGGPGGYLSGVLGASTGFGAVHGAAERGEMSPAEALRRVDAMTQERVRRATPAQRAAVVEQPQQVKTLRKAMRRMLEHDWEHLAELSRRAGGPVL